MSNPAAAARSNAQAKWPGATVHGRARNWLRHQHPSDPNRFMLDVSIGRIHYGPGEDQEIDTAWQPTTGAWQYEMTANDFQTYARDTFNVGGLFQFEKAGQSLMFDPQSINWVDENLSRQQIAIKQAVTAVADDDVLRFVGAYGTGIDFSYQNQTARLQKLIAIDQFNRLPVPTVQGTQVWFEAEFAMSLSAGIEFWLDGMQWDRSTRTATADFVEVRNAAGTEVLWWLGLPRAFDSEGNEVVGLLEVRRQGGPSNLFVTIRIPYAWLETAVYPVYIDPTVDVDVAAGEDDGRYRSDYLSNTDTIISFGREGTGLLRTGYFRFTGVTMAGTITAAHMFFWPTGVYPEGTTIVSVYIDAEDADNPGQLTDVTDALSRARTTAQTSVWVIDDYWTTSVQMQSPDFTAVLQELVDTYTISGDAVQIFWNGHSDTATGVTRGVAAYEHTTSDPATLHVEYSSGPAKAALLDHYQRRKR